MQVVYSGGSTPSPSPRLQRKAGYVRPTMHGYMNHVHPQILVQRSREKFTEGDITLRDSIPAMNRGTAIACLVLNIILPGSGTLAAGLSVLCCSHVRPKEDSKGRCIWVNTGVALLQFLLTFLFLLGWIWSIMWGVAFLTVSKKFFYKRDDTDASRQPKYARAANKKTSNTSQHCRDVKTVRNSTTAKKPHNNHNTHSQDCTNYSHEQYHRYLEPYGHYAFSDSSPGSQCSSVWEYSPTSTGSYCRHDCNNTFLASPVMGSRTIDLKSLHAQQKPIADLQQVSFDSGNDSFNTLTHSPCEETFLKSATDNGITTDVEITGEDVSIFPASNLQANDLLTNDTITCGSVSCQIRELDRTISNV